MIIGVCAGCGARVKVSEPMPVSTSTGVRQAELPRRPREPGEDD